MRLIGIGFWISASTSEAQGVDGSKSITASEGRVAVADVSGVTVFENGKKVNSIALKEGASAVALNGKHLAFGGAVRRHDWYLGLWAPLMRVAISA